LTGIGGEAEAIRSAEGTGQATVDRGRYSDAVTPWEDPSWRAAAVSWAQEQLLAHNLRGSGQLHVRLRPWSVIVRVEIAGGGRVWFKANPPGSAFEPALSAALAEWVPEHVLRPYGVEPERGWSLMPDGGRLVRDLPRDQADWERMLTQYAELQRTLTPQVGALHELGVPAAATPMLPEIFERLLEATTSLDGEDRRRLEGVRSSLGAWVTELAELGIGDSLDHADLHDGQVFAQPGGGFTFFDWGDAAVTHPFCSFLVPARAAAGQDGVAIERLRDAYLEPWTGDGRAIHDLRRGMSLAWRLAAIGRAASWGRLFPGAFDGPQETGDWLVKVLDEPPI
jgi:hypothetical protein